MGNQYRLFMFKITILIISTLFTTSVFAKKHGKPLDYDSIAALNYHALEQALPKYENAVRHPWPQVPQALIKPGNRTKSVLAIRHHLRLTGDLSPEEDSGKKVYDANLVEAVKKFQFRHGLEPDGVIGIATIYELNIPPEQRLMQIRINMNRWSRLSDKLGSRYILINIPAYRLDLVDSGETIMSMRAVVGKPTRQTPEIFSTVKRLVLNPYWNVPNGIAKKDIIPRASRDPYYLQENNIKILDRQANDSYEIYPEEINWERVKYEGFPYHFRQDPGVDNALGLIKFEFPNNKDIFMHDTPSKNLFDRDKRAFSSGCIRIERPFDLADYLMEESGSWNDEMVLDTLESGKTKYLKVSKPTKVVITYVTAWVDDHGNLQFRDDLYGLDGLEQPIY